MSKYNVLTFIGLAIFIVLYLVDYFVKDIPTVTVSIISIIAAVIMIIGLYFRRKDK